MTYEILIRLKSNRKDGKFIDIETGEEHTLEEAIDMVIDYWEDMPSDYHSWGLEKIIFENISTD